MSRCDWPKTAHTVPVGRKARHEAAGTSVTPGGFTVLVGLGRMTQEHLFGFISAVALVVVAAVWLWFLFAYAELIFSR